MNFNSRAEKLFNWLSSWWKELLFTVVKMIFGNLKLLMIYHSEDFSIIRKTKKKRLQLVSQEANQQVDISRNIIYVFKQHINTKTTSYSDDN